MSILIYYNRENEKIDVIIFGDSVATGDTRYGNAGISYTLYLKEYLSGYNLGNYDLTYTKNNMTTSDMIYQIDKNNEINKKHLQYRIKESELIIISLGQDELTAKSLINSLNISERQEFYENYKNLIYKIRKVTKNPIYIIGFYNEKINNIDDVENHLKDIALKNNCVYVSIKENIKNEDYFDSSFFHLNYEGQRKIFLALKKELTL